MGRMLRKVLLRWDGVLVLLLVALPVLVTSVLGFVWLGERGMLLPFVAGAAGLGVFYTTVRFIMRSLAGQAEASVPMPEIPHVEPEADWTDGERAAFDVACRLIRTDASLAPWAEMPGQVRRVLDTVAGTLSGGRRGMMDFTVPEALLLVEQVASRSRDILRRHVPFSDRLPVSWALWAMRHRDRARWAAKAGTVGWRVFRATVNPVQAAIQEIGGLAQGMAVDALSDRFQRELRGLLLEEVAHAAVQL